MNVFFSYHAVDARGRRRRGTADAESADRLARLLESRGLLVLDVERVTPAKARELYGVVLTQDRKSDDCKVDEAATAALRAELKSRRPAPLPMIDRGEGYESMLSGECRPRMRA